MKFRLATLLCFCLFPLSMAQQRVDNFLDLTKVKPHQDEKLVRHEGGGVSVSHDTPFPKLPLQITLLSIDKASYQMGEEMIFDVVIKNVGQDVVVIPWSPYRDRVQPDDETHPAGYADANLGLVLSDKVVGEQVVFGPWLYGSDRVPSSLKRLRPGKTVRIRAAGRWALTSADASQVILSRLPQSYSVRAIFSLSRHTFNPQPRPVISANSATVELNKRKK